MERQPGTWERGFPKLVMYYVSLSCTSDTKLQSHIKRCPKLGARDNLSHSLPLHAPHSLTLPHKSLMHSTHGWHSHLCPQCTVGVIAHTLNAWSAQLLIPSTDGWCGHSCPECTVSTVTQS